MSTCDVCDNVVQRNKDNIACIECKSLFHIKCVHLKSSELGHHKNNTLKWKCESCKDTGPGTSHASCSPLNQAKGGRSVITLENIATMIKELKCDNQDIRSELRAINEKLNDQTDHLRALEMQLQESREEIQSLRESTAALGEENKSLKTRLESAEQRFLGNTLEIQGIPDNRGENLTSVVITLGRELGIEVAPEELNKCYRHGPSRDGSRSLAVEFVRQMKRDDFLKKGKSRNFVYQDRRVYVNEALTPYFRRLLFLARKARAETSNKFKYVWVSKGQIFARPRDGAEPFRVFTEEDIKRIK